MVGQTVFTWLIAEAYLRKPSKLWIVGGVVANLAVLGFFKYALFVAGAAVSFVGLPEPGWNIVLPIGISFYTFEFVSYLVDLKRGTGGHYGLRKFCLFVFLFPHLIAGPIIRHNEIIPQFDKSPLRPGLGATFGWGIAFFVIGCAKKVLIADPLASDHRSDLQPRSYPRAHRCLARRARLHVSAVPRLLGLFGDGDRARADARHALPRQFQRALSGDRYPGVLAALAYDAVALGSATISIFRSAAAATAGAVYIKATLITMGLCGLWHGAGFTFIAWGLMHGVALIVCHVWQKSGRELSAPRVGPSPCCS